MFNFKYYLEKIGEIGYVEQVTGSIAYVRGLPKARPQELIVFESGQIGQVFSLSYDYVEVLILSNVSVAVSSRATRTGELFTVAVGEELLGKMLSPLGLPVEGEELEPSLERRPIDVKPLGIKQRKNIDEPFETGVTIVDLVVPLGKGQRELVVGDRKTNKTQFLLQVILTQAQKGTICIYAGIGKRVLDIKMVGDFFKKNAILSNTIIVASSASDPAGLVFLTPYTAMTIAEFFRDRGKDVLVVFDDLTAHAKYYREITLLAKRFPGRSSYPGDIFYIHSKLLERGGNFSLISKDARGKLEKKEVAITCLPVGELVLGDLSGYIQTNLMAMTDGHIFFDREYFNEGRRPAVNPFLSVTRVGRQAQSPLARELSRQLISFLVKHEKLKQFLHFGAELSEETRRTLAQGEKIVGFFEQSSDKIIPLPINIFILACIWAGFWKELETVEAKRKMEDLRSRYLKDSSLKQKVDSFLINYKDFSELVGYLKANGDTLFS